MVKKIKFSINKKCKDAFLVGYPVCQKYFIDNFIPGDDYVVELLNGYVVVSLEKIEK